MRKKILPTFIILIGFGLLIMSFLYKSPTPKKIVEMPNTTSPESSENKTNPVQKIAVSKKDISKTEAYKNIPEIKKIKVSISVKNSVYNLNVPENSSIFEAMNIATSTTSFSFSAKYYAGIGYYVDKINNIKNSNKAFWIYYVNGKEANVGIYNYILKENDNIRWRYEDSQKNEI